MVFPQTNWERVAPEAAGIDSRAIERALEAIAASEKDIHSMLIVRGGKLAFETYLAPYEAETAHSMFSCSKTFTSMLIGIAQGKGLLSIHDKVLPYFPDVAVEKPNDNLREMTLEDLLMMGSGHGEDTFGHMMEAEDGDWARVFLNQIVDHKPGTHFVYNTGATYMLSAVLTRVTGKTALELANEWIFSKIGIAGAEWEASPQGVSMGGTGLHIRPLDMARFGLLISNEGRWNGEQIIPADYIQAAQTKHIDNKNPDDPNQNPNWAAGYCYQMWRCAFPAFRADGMGGQYIVMLPERELVFVFTSGLGADIGYPLDVIRDILLPGIADKPLPANPAGLAAMEAAAQRLYKPAPQARPAEAEALPWDKKIALDENEMGFTSLTLGTETLTLGYAGGALELPYHWYAPVCTKEPVALPGAPTRRMLSPMVIATRAKWLGGLVIWMQFVGTPLILKLSFSFRATDVAIDIYTTMGEPFSWTGKL